MIGKLIEIAFKRKKKKQQ